MDDLHVEKIDLHILKGQEKLVESYSAFIDPWGLFPSKLEESLKDAEITKVFVVGLGLTQLLIPWVNCSGGLLR